MKTLKFKVGDRVKIIKSPGGIWNGKLCKVIEVFSEGYPYRIQELSNIYWECLMNEDELGSCLEKGQQLLFSFMK